MCYCVVIVMAMEVNMSKDSISVESDVVEVDVASDQKGVDWLVEQFGAPEISEGGESGHDHEWGSGVPKAILDPKIVRRFCDAFRVGASVKGVCKALDCNTARFYSWLRRGRKETYGPFRDFYNAIESAKEEHWDEQKLALERVLYDRALNRQVTTQRRVSRLVSIPRSAQIVLDEEFLKSPELKAKFDEDGIIIKEEITIVEFLPDTHRALQILERRDSKGWRKR